MTHTATAHDPVSAAQSRIDGYWYQDGISEIGMAIAMLGTAGLMYMVHTHLANGRYTTMGVVIGAVGVALGFVDGRIKSKLRERFTYPRIGYLSDRPRAPLSLRRKAAIATILTLTSAVPFALIWYVLDRHEPLAVSFGWMRRAPIVFGPFLGAGMAIDYERFKLPRLLIAGFLVSVSGVVCSLFIGQALLPTVVFCLAAALIQLMSGASALVRMVRTVPAST